MARTTLVLVAALVTGCAATSGLSPEAHRTATRPPAIPTVLQSAERGSAAASALEPSGAPAPRAVLDCVEVPEVDRWERRFARERAAWQRMLDRGQHYDEVRRIVEEEGLPPGLALLPAIESGYRVDARGPHGGRGLWQFRATTARLYGLVVTDSRDDRVHVGRSTRAALRLLRDLRERYGSWSLALAAYNAGEGRVQRAMKVDGDATFWRLAHAERLPQTTRTYVPKFLGLVRALGDEDGCADAGPPTVVVAAD